MTKQKENKKVVNKKINKVRKGVKAIEKVVDLYNAWNSSKTLNMSRLSNLERKRERL